jgi:hypothetical protein
LETRWVSGGERFEKSAERYDDLLVDDLARTLVEYGFDAFEYRRALTGARSSFVQKWGESSANCIFGVRLFDLAIADAAAWSEPLRLSRQTITSNALEEELRREGSERAVADETIRSAPRDLALKLAHFESYFALDDDWFRFTFEPRQSSPTAKGSARVERYLGVSVEARSVDEVPSEAHDLRPMTSDPAPISRLPLERVPSPDFLGRNRELRLIRHGIRSWREPPIIAINGAPGVGKTDLALAAALDLRYRYNEILYVAIPEASSESGAQRQSGHTTAVVTEVINRLLSAFDNASSPLGPVNVDSFRGIYTSLLQGRHVLVVCDNAPSAALADLFRPPVGCAMVVTSRAAIGLRGLAAEIELQPLDPVSGASLLARLVPDRFGSHWTLPKDTQSADGDRDVVTDAAIALALASFCEGIPLALETVATHIRIRPDLDIGSFLEELINARRTLNLSPEAADTIAPPVRATFELSFRALRDEMKQAFARAALFPGSFDGEAGAAVLGDPDLVRELARHRLIRFDGSPPRYSMLILLRSFALEKLGAARPLLEETLRRFAQYFASYATRLSVVLESPTPDAFVESLHAFDREAVNLNETMHLLSHRVKGGTEWAGLALKFAPLLNHPRIVNGYSNFGWAQTVVTAAECECDDALLREGLLHLGIALSHNPGGLPASVEVQTSAIAALSRCREAAREAGDRELERQALDELIWSARCSSRHADVLRYISEKVDLEPRPFTRLETLLDILLAAELVFTQNSPIPPLGLPDFEFGPRQQSGLYASLVLFDVLRAFPGQRRMLDFELRTLKALTAGLTLDRYLAGIVDTRAYSEIGPLRYLKRRLAGASGRLPQFPINCIAALPGLTNKQRADWLDEGFEVAISFGWNLAAAHMKCVRGRMALNDGEIEVAKAAIKHALKLARTETHADEVINAARLMEREIKTKKPGRTQPAKARTPRR